MAQARALHEPKDSGDTEPHPSVTQPPSNRRWPTDLQGSFSTSPACGKVGKVLSTLYKREKQFSHKVLSANQ